jgi:hypothetical protein
MEHFAIGVLMNIILILYSQRKCFIPHQQRLITVAERSRACIVFARSEAGTVVSNPTQGIDVKCLCMCMRFSMFVYR